MQEAAHSGPEALVGGRQLQGAGCGRKRGAAGWRRGALREAGARFEELDGGGEAAAAGVHDEIDGPAAAAAAAMVEELAAGDAEDRAGEFPAGRVARVAAVAELGGERFQRDVADAAGAVAPCPCPRSRT